MLHGTKDGVIDGNQLSTFNTNRELTDENAKAGNALWAYLVDVPGTGSLVYKASNPKKARTYAAVTLLKRIRKEHAAGDVKPVPKA